MDKYVFVKGIAGLGNRIFVLVSAILYARLSNRSVVVDWSDSAYTTNQQNVFPLLFELKNIAYAQQLTASSSVYPAFWKPCLDLSMEDVIHQDHGGQFIGTMGQGVFRKYACALSNLNYSEDIVIASGYDEEIETLRPLLKKQSSHFARAPKGAIFGEAFHQHLALAPAVRQRLDAFQKKYMTGKQFVGIHIRKSDKAISYGWYKQALAEHVDRYPEAHIFLATDNREVEREIGELYPNKVVTLDKWLPEPGIAVHGNTDCPDLEEHAVTALLDIFLLASCDYLIYSRTTSFGRLASYISKMPVEQHFDIQLYNDRRKKSPGEKIKRLSNKVSRNVKYGVSWLKLKGILPSR